MIKFICSSGNKTKGHCKTTVQDSYGRQYTGHAWLANGDTWSEIFGCRIAELRATVQAINYKIYKKKADYKTIENFVKAVGGYKKFDKESPSAKCMYRQLNRRKAEIKRLEQEREAIKQFIKDSIDMRDRITNRINRKNSGKES